MSKRTILSIALLVIVSALTFAFPKTGEAPTTTPESVVAEVAPVVQEAEVLSEQNTNATLTVGESIYAVHVTEGDSVLSVMEELKTKGTLDFEGRDYPGLGYFVDTIAGTASGNGKYWILYINGQKSALGASAVTLSPGDAVEWRFEDSY